MTILNEGVYIHLVHLIEKVDYMRTDWGRLQAAASLALVIVSVWLNGCVVLIPREPIIRLALFIWSLL